MATVTLSITGGRNDKLAQFYSCGKPGDELYAKAQEVMEQNDRAAVRDFIRKNFSEPDVEMFVHSLDDNGGISVCVEDERGRAVFVDEEWGRTAQSGIIDTDPRKWEFDESMGEPLTSAIRELVEKSNDDIDAALAQWEKEYPGEALGPDLGELYLEGLASDVIEKVVKAPFEEAGFGFGDTSPELLFAAFCSDLYGTGAMSCEIELADGEEFDPDKLKLMLHDYDGYYFYCADSIPPVVIYGNKFYRLSRDTWEAHHEYYGFAKKDEGRSYMEFSGEDF